MAHLVLYRKYRPRVFRDIVGQPHVVTVLQNTLREGRVAHAYLFSGLRGTGKTTLARLFAKAINCEKLEAGNEKLEAAQTEPCNKCQICDAFNAGHAPDLIEMDAASTRGIDDIRELKEGVYVAPLRARKKVYVIDEVHMLTKEAFNALLKTLEEPPDHALFLFATTEPEKVPATILSRVTRFALRPVPAELIEKRLQSLAKQEHIALASEAARVVARLAEGSLRDAETMLGTLLDAFPGGVAEEEARLVFGLPKAALVGDLREALFARDRAKAFAVMQSGLAEGTDPRMLARMVAEDVRSMWKAKNFMHTEGSDILHTLAHAYPSRAEAIAPELPLEVAIIELTKEKE
ncbi:MAG: DNA polymerase III subunit gamma/tau [Patescibacteria group bacterium]